MNIDTIVLFTSSFPFGKKEPFLETEIQILASYFEKIYIVPNTVSSQIRDVPKNVYILDEFASKKGSKFTRLIDSLKWSIFYKELVKELFNINYLKQVILMSYYAKNLPDVIDELIINKNINLDSCVFYTYWFGPQTYALSKLKMNKYKNLCFISRLHSGDIYEYRHKIKNFPFRIDPIININYLFPISKDAQKHLVNKFSFIKDKTFIYRLGIDKISKNKIMKKNQSIFKIVSCSSMVKVKRIEKIISVLKEAKNDPIHIEWTHIGDGELKHKIIKESTFLPSNVKSIFLGQMSNSAVMELYKNNNFDLFINLSSSEGIPVSIMEAQSFSIPVLATDVGGVSEIVNNINGILVEKNTLDYEIFKKIKYLYLNKKTLDLKRNYSYINWKDNYSTTNYIKFCEFIKKNLKN